MTVCDFSGEFPMEKELIKVCDCPPKYDNLTEVPVFSWKTLWTLGCFFGMSPHCPECGKKLEEIAQTGDPNSVVATEVQYKCKKCGYKYAFTL